MTTLAEVRSPPISYDSRDYRSARADMVRAIPFYTSDWTAHVAGDQGMVLLELLAGSSDVLHYYLDRAAMEAFRATAIKRESVIELLRLIGYELRSAVPSSVDVVFTLPQAFPDPVTIPKGTKLQTARLSREQPIVFETSADLVIPAGELTGEVAAVQGETREEMLDPSTGTAYMFRELLGTSIIDGTGELYIDEGVGEVLWTEVSDNFAQSDGTDRHYYAQKNDADGLTLFFGDNSQGRIPAAGATMRYVYRMGGGAYGNIGAGVLETVASPLNHMGGPLTVSVTNPAAASGGEDEQSIEDAKRQGPRSLRALDRAVSPGDYEALAEGFPGVARARFMLGDGSGCCGCDTRLLAIPTGGGVMSSQLRADLLAYFDTRKMAGDCLELGDAKEIPVDISGTLFVGANFDQAEILADVQAAHAAYFDLESAAVDFGRGAKLSDVFRALDEVVGVDYIDLHVMTRRPLPSYDLWSGDAVLDDTVDETTGAVAVGATAVDEVWTVTFLTPTTFSVSGSVSGIQPNQGTVGTLYQAAGGQVSFRVLEVASGGSGSGPGGSIVPPAVGDRVTFRTGPRRDNVPLAGDEIMVPGKFSLDVQGGAVVQTRC